MLTFVWLEVKIDANASTIHIQFLAKYLPIFPKFNLYWRHSMILEWLEQKYTLNIWKSCSIPILSPTVEKVIICNKICLLGLVKIFSPFKYDKHFGVCFLKPMLSTIMFIILCQITLPFNSDRHFRGILRLRNAQICL